MPGEVVVDNGATARVVRVIDGHVHTIAIGESGSGERLEVEEDSEEFRIELASGLELTTFDFEVTAVTVTTAEEREELGDEVFAGVSPDAVVSAIYALEGPDGWAAEVRYFARDGSAQLYKEISVTPPPGGADRFMELDVERLEVAGAREEPVVPRDVTGERRLLTTGRIAGGKGLGQPLFLDHRYFVGLEYPAGVQRLEGGILHVGHFPGMIFDVLDGGALRSKTAVFGVATSGTVREAFRTYVRGSVARPPRRERNCIDAFHLRGRANIGVGINAQPTPEELEMLVADQPALRALVRTEENAIAYATAAREFARHWGFEVDSFAIDGGWQDARTVFAIDPVLLPNGFGAIRDASGTSLGLWTSLAGFRLDIAYFAEEHGYRACPPATTSFDLSQPDYLAAMTERMVELSTEYDITYWKQDFNFLTCPLETPYHPADDPQSFEANLDALLSIIRAQRATREDAYIAQTTFTWQSPWWLSDVDAVVNITADYGYSRDVPAFRPRDWAVTFVDGAQFDTYVENGAQYPTSRVMTHGIIHDRYVFVGGNEETIESWADHVVAHLAPGMTLQELYVDPDMVPDAHAAFLTGAFEWMDENEATLFRWGEMFGGDPREGEAYGFAHEGDRQIVFLRNPSGEPRTITAPFREQAGEPVTVLYPYLASTGQDAGPIDVTLEPYEVRVLATGGPAWLEAGVRYAVEWAPEGPRIARATESADPPPPIEGTIAPNAKSLQLAVPEGAEASVTVILDGRQDASMTLSLDGVAIDPGEVERREGPCGPVGCPLSLIETWTSWRVSVPAGAHVVSWEPPEDTTVHAVFVENVRTVPSEAVEVDPGQALLPSPSAFVRRTVTNAYHLRDFVPVDPLTVTERIEGALELRRVQLTAPLPAQVDVAEKAGGVVTIPIVIDPGEGTVEIRGAEAALDGTPTGGRVELMDVQAIGALVLTLSNYVGSFDPENNAMSIPMNLAMKAPAFDLDLDLTMDGTTGRSSQEHEGVTAEARGQVLAVDGSLAIAGTGVLPEAVPLIGNQPFGVVLRGVIPTAIEP